jgi:drug/metabolite transporter (DMT)-like permease
MRIAAPVLGAVWLIELRVLIAGLALLPVVIYRRELGSLLTNAKGLLIVGALNAALPFTLLAYATIDLSAGMTSILNATVPIFSALYAYLVTREELGTGKLTGVALGFVGVVVLVGWHQEGLEGTPMLSVAAGLLGALSYVIAANYTKRNMTNMPPMAFVVGSQLSAALLLIPLMPFFLPQQSPDMEVVLSVLGLALLSTALAFGLYFHLIKQIGPTQTLTVTYLIPLFAIIWGTWLLNESFTLAMLIGCILILSGTALANGVRVPLFSTSKHHESQ